MPRIELPDNIEAAIKLALQLRNSANEQELIFIRYLVDLEATRELWMPAAPPDGTFAGLLDRWHICDPKRYEHGKRALAVYGEERIARIGMPAARVFANKLGTTDMHEAAAREAEVSAEAIGAPPSERTALRINEKIRRQFGESPPKIRVSRVDELEEELRSAKVRIGDLERENQTLREQVEELTGTARGAGNAPSRSRATRKTRPPTSPEAG